MGGVSSGIGLKGVFGGVDYFGGSRLEIGIGSFVFSSFYVGSVLKKVWCFV